MTKYRVPTEEEKEILRRNGIDPEHVAVFYREERRFCLLNHLTRDRITVTQGDKPWSQEKTPSCGR